MTPYDTSHPTFSTRLARFKTDYIDLYLLHRDPTVPVGPIVDTLNQHLKAGRIHAFGGSNWTHTRVQQANEYAKTNDACRASAPAVQTSASPNRSKNLGRTGISISGPKTPPHVIITSKHILPLFTWSSLAEAFSLDASPVIILRQLHRLFPTSCASTSYCYEDNFKRLDRVRQLSQEIGLSIPQVALAYVMSQPLDIYALVGCQNGDEFAANIAAADHRLSPETLAWLDLQSDAH